MPSSHDPTSYDPHPPLDDPTGASPEMDQQHRSTMDPGTIGQEATHEERAATESSSARDTAAPLTSSTSHERATTATEPSPPTPLDAAQRPTSSSAAHQEEAAPDPPELPLPPPPSATQSTPTPSGFGFGLGALVDAFLTGFRNAAGTGASQASQQTEQPSSENDAPAPSSNPSDTQEEPRPSASGSPEQTPAQDATTGPASDADAPSNGNAQGEEQARTLFFRMPFAGPDGSPALLAFTPGPLPRESNQVGQRPDQPAAAASAAAAGNTGSTTEPAAGPERPPQSGEGQSSTEQSQRFHVPVAPIFVPLGASPLPFSFIFDAVSSTAWPVVSVSSASASTAGGTPPDGMPGSDGQPRLVAGPPFHIMLDINFGPPPPPPEQPDPERAARFVSSLERADEELRDRMKILGIGEIGHYGGGDDGGDAEVGCGICLDSYEDRPAWLDGLGVKEGEARDGECVAVPCAGHHTLHAGCLRSYLASKVVKDWSCPFCRASLCPAKVEESATTNAPASATSQSSAQKKAIQEAAKRTLREEIRLRERQGGWRCDNPACLPRYPEGEKKGGEDRHGQSEAGGAEEEREDEDEDQTLVELKPCHHQIHLDCLLLSQRLEFPASDEEDEEDEEEEEEEGEEGDGAEDGASDDLEGSEVERSDGEEEEEDDDEAEPEPPKSKTVGRWVTCPCCRKEAWAVIPVRRRRREVGEGKGGGRGAAKTEGKRRRTRRCSGRKGGERKRRRETGVVGAQGSAQAV